MMKNLCETRARYVRLLDALNPGRGIDQDLRVEIEDTIEAIDRKIDRMNSRERNQVAVLT